MATGPQSYWRTSSNSQEKEESLALLELCQTSCCEKDSNLWFLWRNQKRRNSSLKHVTTKKKMFKFRTISKSDWNFTNNMCSEKSSSCVLLNEPTSSGREPLKLLWAKSMEDKVEKRPDGLGIETPRWLQERLRICRLVRFSRLSGMFPVKLFSAKFNWKSKVRLPMDSGMEEESLFLLKTNCCKFWSFPILNGIEPERQFLSKPSWIKLKYLGMPAGMSPANWFPPASRILSLVERLVKESGKRRQNHCHLVPLFLNWCN